MVEAVNGNLFGSQIRAARALLGWSAADLAKASSVGANTIRRAEVEDGILSMTAANQRAVRQALEVAGVQFIEQNGGGPGVRLRKPYAD
jgi:ribosome-binding protein aMBF1 (putative translation factor)